MSSDTVQCPHCNTRFRVQREQLQLADGLVRCGRCMEIFNAIDGSAIPTLEHTEAEAAGEPAEQEGPPEDVQDGSVPIEDAPQERDPLELLDSLSTVDHDFEHHMTAPRRRSWPWLLASLAALLVLVAQVAQWQMPQLLASPYGEDIRHYCQRYKIPCEVKEAPNPNTVDHISSSNLMVRKHPDRAGALIIDTLLTNKSNSASPFPALRLRFSDINDHTVASRVFQPRDYLTGELNALSDLASQQPIHVVLEIRDPGSHAVNYELQLLPGHSGFNRR